jgi:predicted ATPase
VITSLEISGLRGIREGKLDNLTPLTILVGPNGCGKSTVLDALLIGASPSTGDGIGRAVQRHRGIRRGARWLFWRAEQTGSATIVVRTSTGAIHKCIVRLESNIRVLCEVESNNGQPLREKTATNIGDPPAYSSEPNVHMLEALPRVRLVESFTDRLQTPLHQLVTACTEQGQRPALAQIAGSIIPGVKDVLILTEEDSPLVHLEFADHSLPAALSGDGVYFLLRICLEALASPDGILLFEEPEGHQHPAAIRQTVRAILDVVRRGIQVILTTHSLELIDAFLAESSSEDLERLSLFKLELHEGKLISVRVPGSDVAFARGEIEEDLR